MAYSLIDIYTKNYWNRTMIVNIIVGNWLVSFVGFLSLAGWTPAYRTTKILSLRPIGITLSEGDN